MGASLFPVYTKNLAHKGKWAPEDDSLTKAQILYASEYGRV